MGFGGVASSNLSALIFCLCDLSPEGVGVASLSREGVVPEWEPVTNGWQSRERLLHQQRMATKGHLGRWAPNPVRSAVECEAK